MIGVFDSGIGGLSVVKEIKKLLPDISVMYLGDTARVPYGTRSKEIINKFAKEDTLFFKDKKIDLLVVACNTVSAQALTTVKKYSIVPVVDVISPIEEKIRKFKNLGLVGTRATVTSLAYKNVKTRHHASLLVPLIEEGIVKGKELNIFIKKYFSHFKKTNCIVLGCTHYSIIKKEIQKFLSKGVVLIDPAVEVAKKVKKILTNKKIKKTKDIYYLTDVNQRFLATAKMFLKKDISAYVRKAKI